MEQFIDISTGIIFAFIIYYVIGWVTFLAGFFAVLFIQRLPTNIPGVKIETQTYIDGEKHGSPGELKPQHMPDINPDLSIKGHGKILLLGMFVYYILMNIRNSDEDKLLEDIRNGKLKDYHHSLTFHGR